MSTPLIADAAGVIIAGGKATRFGGRVKALIEIGGVAILDRVLGVMDGRLSAVAIAANDRAPYAHTGVTVLPDRAGQEGPLAGLASALGWCRRPYLIALASDMPHVSSDILELLLSHRAGDVDAVVPFVGDQPEPLCALYARRVQEVVEDRLQRGRLSARGLVLDEGLRVVRIDEPELRRLDSTLSFLTNINRPEDLR